MSPDETTHTKGMEMLTPIAGAEFADRFPASNELGTKFGMWADEAENVHWYYTNAKGEVGEVIYEPRTTKHAYNIVTGWEADELKRLYSR